MSTHRREPAAEEYIKMTEELVLADGGTPEMARNIARLNICTVEQADEAPLEASSEALFVHLKKVLEAALEELGYLHEAESVQRHSSLTTLAPLLARRFDILQPEAFFKNFSLLCAASKS